MCKIVGPDSSSLIWRSAPAGTRSKRKVEPPLAPGAPDAEGAVGVARGRGSLQVGPYRRGSGCSSLEKDCRSGTSWKANVTGAAEGAANGSGCAADLLVAYAPLGARRCLRVVKQTCLPPTAAATVWVLLCDAHQARAAVRTLLRLKRPGAEAGHRDIRRGVLAFRLQCRVVIRTCLPPRLLRLRWYCCMMHPRLGPLLKIC